ncbi:Aste57867_15173 [Aphanomyces stellatus]|uniref:Aste57867_15173 protein n=1 Tax=Aphanomyces stellatus TaxID=120398 RepID=A0A485L2T6_9STRA|nr:hypothetical protein As57867_015117 [Aphanomyces stellatus]VFT91982.1 Aste57867_15173 [Aphanomyces stellatus]
METATPSSQPASAIDAPEFNHRVTLQCGRHVSFADVGDSRGFPVLFLLGMQGHRYHSFLFSTLAHRHGIRLICIDRPGYGLSDDVASPDGAIPHPIAFVYVVEQLLAFLAIEQCGLMAQSAGCIYALALAAQPSLAARLVQPIMLVAPWVGIENPHMPSYVKAATYCPMALISTAITLIGASMSLAPYMMGLTRVVTPMGSATDNTDDDEAPLVAQDDPSHMPLLVGDFLPRIQAEPHNGHHDALLCLGKTSLGVGFTLDQIHASVHVFHGDKDALVPLSAAKTFVAQLPQAKLDVIQDGTHMILLEERVVDKVFQALADAVHASGVSMDTEDCPDTVSNS